MSDSHRLQFVWLAALSTATFLGCADDLGLEPESVTVECTDPESSPTGWASLSADGLSGTTGGEGGEVIDVSTTVDFRAALAGAVARIVRVSGQIGEGSHVDVGSNKTIVGAPGAIFVGRIWIKGQSNVIVRNMTFRGHDCEGLVNSSGCSDDDAITVQGSHHLWFDHLSVYDGSDGNLDITHGADYITISWTKFWYSRGDRPHRLSNLVAANDDDPEDVGRLKITWHHNWWAAGVDDRMPRTRRGLIHIFNNLYTAGGNASCIRAGFEATHLVEANIFRYVSRPHLVDPEGHQLARGNVYEGTGQGESDGIGFEPPYPYDALTTEGLDQLIMQCAGPH